jgi:hypothetical protein
MGDDGVSRFSRFKFHCMPGVFDSAGPLRTHAYARNHVAFWRTDTMGFPIREISELNTQPTDAPVQRFECGLAAALTWLGVRVVRYSFPVRLFHSLLQAGLSRRYPVHLAHSAGGEERIDAIGTERLSRLQGNE